MINEMTDKFGSKMTSLSTMIDKSLRRRDDIYFMKFDDHAAAVHKLQEVNSQSMKRLCDKVFDIGSSIRQHKELTNDRITRTDVAMALVHQQREASDKRYEDL